MNRETYNKTQRGLIATAQEKINVLGRAEAQEDLVRIRETIADLQDFWDGDGDLGGRDWEEVMDQLMGQAPKKRYKVVESTKYKNFIAMPVDPEAIDYGTQTYDSHRKAKEVAEKLAREKYPELWKEDNHE
mgnify:CR=1 FL=1